MKNLSKKFIILSLILSSLLSSVYSYNYNNYNLNEIESSDLEKDDLNKKYSQKIINNYGKIIYLNYKATFLQIKDKQIFKEIERAKNKLEQYKEIYRKSGNIVGFWKNYEKAKKIYDDIYRKDLTKVFTIDNIIRNNYEAIAKNEAKITGKNEIQTKIKLEDLSYGNVLKNILIYCIRNNERIIIDNTDAKEIENIETIKSNINFEKGDKILVLGETLEKDLFPITF